MTEKWTDVLSVGSSDMPQPEQPAAFAPPLQPALAELRALPDESRAVLRRALALPEDVAVALRALL